VKTITYFSRLFIRMKKRQAECFCPQWTRQMLFLGKAILSQKIYIYSPNHKNWQAVAVTLCFYKHLHTKLKTYQTLLAIHFLSPCASGRIPTFGLGTKSQLLYHCAAAIQQRLSNLMEQHIFWMIKIIIEGATEKVYKLHTPVK